MGIEVSVDLRFVAVLMVFLGHPHLIDEPMKSNLSLAKPLLGRQQSSDQSAHKRNRFFSKPLHHGSSGAGCQYALP